MSLTQLNPPIPVWTTEHGDGMAIAWLDYGIEYHLIWGVALDKGGAIMWLENPKIRLTSSLTIGRTKDEPVHHATKVTSGGGGTTEAGPLQHAASWKRGRDY